jgi:hypothetical protein
MLLLIFYLLHAPFYFMIPLYGVLLAVGSIWIEERIVLRETERRRSTFARAALPVVYVLGSLPLLPLGMPVLPVDQLAKYVSAIGVNAGIKTSSAGEGVLPQHFADRFGSEEMVQAIAAVYHSSPGSTGEIGILTGNYSEAAAVHFYRSRYDLPEPISTHGWFYFHTLQTHSFKRAYVSLGVSANVLREMFSVVERKGMFSHPYCMPYENNQPVYFCAKPKLDLRRRWLIDRYMDPHFRVIIDSAGVLKAIEYYHAVKKADPAVVLFTEKQINDMGYEYLRKGRVDDSILLFAFNAETFPESTNVYDSMGEAYFIKGDYALAARSYGSALRLDSLNGNAREYIKKLETLVRAPR